LLDQKNLKRSGSGGARPTRKAAHENMVIVLNSSFLAVKCKTMRNGHGGQWLWFLRSYLMAQNNFWRSGSEGPRPTRKAWAIAHENMGIEQNSSFLAVKRKTNEECSWRGGGYGSVGRI